MDIYAPIAHRLGNFPKIKVELDDLSLKYLKPDVYEEFGTFFKFQKRRTGSVY